MPARPPTERVSATRPIYWQGFWTGWMAGAAFVGLGALLQEVLR